MSVSSLGGTNTAWRHRAVHLATRLRKLLAVLEDAVAAQRRADAARNGERTGAG
ncbi:hypothetical protein [Streptomyces sp. NPDC008092]|uniref:hypothetical protein n=1 Tax=Streptomyces sp. NPDC008092 TaxID=3364808 RepID=UPI0036E310B4